MRFFASLIVLLCFVDMAYGETFICQVDKQVICSKKSCNEVNPKGEHFRRIDTLAMQYEICDKKDCNLSVPVDNIFPNGIFVHYEMSGSAFLKMAIEDEPLLLGIEKGDFYEQRDVGLNTILSWGKCKTN